MSMSSSCDELVDGIGSVLIALFGGGDDSRQYLSRDSRGFRIYTAGREGAKTWGQIRPLASFDTAFEDTIARFLRSAGGVG